MESANQGNGKPIYLLMIAFWAGFGFLNHFRPFLSGYQQTALFVVIISQTFKMWMMDR